jgi:protein-disulfide isomerase
LRGGWRQVIMFSMFKDKGLLIGVLATVLLIGGGIFYFTKDNSTPTEATPVNTSVLAPITSYTTGGFVNGNYLGATESAKIAITEFGDFQCPACGSYHPMLKQMLTEFAGKVNFTFRNFPLTQHKNSNISAQAAEAAGIQGKFWQMHDKIYETQAEWSGSSDAKNIFISYAQALNLNVEQFKKDIDSDSVKNKIQSDTNDGNLVKVDATPTFYLNGVKMDTMPPTYEGIQKLINSELGK